MSSVIVEHKNGKKFDLDALGYHVKTFEPWGSDWTQSSTSINKYLLLDTSRKVQAKTATLELNTMASDVTGLQLKFMDLTRVFNGEYNFYIYFAEIPHIRWEATVSGSPTFTMVIPALVQHLFHCIFQRDSLKPHIQLVKLVRIFQLISILLDFLVLVLTLNTTVKIRFIL